MLHYFKNTFGINSLLRQVYTYEFDHVMNHYTTFLKTTIVRSGSNLPTRPNSYKWKPAFTDTIVYEIYTTK